MKMKMRDRATIFLLFMLLFALFSSTTAVPSSRSLKSQRDDEYSSRYHKINQEEEKKKGRIDVEVSDYSGTGANNHHDPKSPPASFSSLPAP